MKIYLKVFGCFMLITLASTSVVSCDKGNKTGSNPFIGTWIGSWEGDESVMEITESTWFAYLSSAEKAYVGAYTYTGNSGKFIANSQGLTGEAIVTGNTITLAIPRMGSMKATKVDYKTYDKKLNGTWILTEGGKIYESKMNNGTFEDSTNGVLDVKGIYNTDNGSYYSKVTHFYGKGDICESNELNLEAKWYTFDEYKLSITKKYGITEEWFYEANGKNFLPKDYSAGNNSLTIGEDKYTRK